jgi:transcriptional regulator with XRE-family HTH domain
MQTIGERLEEARKRKGISIREASEATKIRSEYLHKFEGNSFDLNLPEIYVRGFLRNYGTYLKLNGDKLVADYKSLVPTEGRASRRENRENYGRTDLGQASRLPDTETASSGDGAEVPAAADPTTLRTKSFPASAGTTAAPIDPALLIKIGGAVLAVILVVAIILGIRAISGGSPKPAAEAGPAATQQTVTLTAAGPVDVQVREEVDGPIIWRGHMEANDSHSLVKRGKLFVTATEMKNIQIEVSGKHLPNPYSGLMKVQIP